MIKLIGCNNHLGVSEPGLTKNIESIKNLYPTLDILRVNEVLCEEEHSPKFKNFHSVYETNQLLSKACYDVLTKKIIPINILGDHAASIGTVSASSQFCDNLGLIWVDAHPDINTPLTTLSGNIHGMPIAALLNLFDSPLGNVLFDGQKIKKENIVYLGLRDIDEAEQIFLDELEITYFTYKHVVELGLGKVLEVINKKFEANDKLHISVDMDSMDPLLVPGVSVPVENGFTPEDIVTILKQLISYNNIVSIDIVEYNPEYDMDHISANVLKQLIDTITKLLDD